MSSIGRPLPRSDAFGCYFRYLLCVDPSANKNKSTAVSTERFCSVKFDCDSRLKTAACSTFITIIYSLYVPVAVKYS